MSSHVNYLLWVLILPVTRVYSGAPESNEDQYLERLNKKCNGHLRAGSGPQSFFSSYCFQYNTLSNIHQILAFGEELLQIGPIDLINLKSVHPHQATTSDTPHLVYPENSAEQIRQSNEKSKLERLRSEDAPKTESKFETIGGRLDRDRKSMKNSSHLETKRDLKNKRAERFSGTEDTYFVQSEEEDDPSGENQNEMVQDKVDYYYSSDESVLDESNENNVENDEEKISDTNIKHKNNAPKTNRKHKDLKNIRDHLKYVMINEISREEENIDAIRNKPKERSEEIFRKNTNTRTNNYFIDSSVKQADKWSNVDSLVNMKPESRSLLKSSGDKEIQVLKMKEDRYFLADDHQDSSSSIEDFAMSEYLEASTITPLAVSQQPVPLATTNTPDIQPDQRADDSMEARDDEENAIDLEQTLIHGEDIKRDSNETELTSNRVDKLNDKASEDVSNNHPTRSSINQTDGQSGSTPLTERIANQNPAAHGQLLSISTQFFQPSNNSVSRIFSGQGTTHSMKAIDEADSTSWLSHLDEIAGQLSDIFSTYGITVPIPDWSGGLPAIIPQEERGGKKRDQSTSRRRTHKHSSNKKYMALFPLVAVLKFMVIKALLVPILISVLIIKKIIILGVIALPYVFSLLRICRNGPGFGFLFGGGGGGGGLGGNQVAANAPYLSAVDTSVDYTGAYGPHAASYKDFGGGARWIDRHYPNMMGGVGGGSKMAGEVGLIER